MAEDEDEVEVEEAVEGLIVHDLREVPRGDCGLTVGTVESYKGSC